MKIPLKCNDSSLQFLRPTYLEGSLERECIKVQQVSVRLSVGKEIRENIFSEVQHLLHALDAGMLPISVFFPHLPIPQHKARDR